MSPTDDATARGYRAVADLYHAYLTGLILTAVSRRGAADAAELVFRTFRRQHLEKFLPGLLVLGLDRPPHAVACAQYRYLSNQLAELMRRLGEAQGDRVECAREGDEVVVRQRTWRLMHGVANPSPAVFDAWSALWEGAASVHDRRLVLVVARRLDWGDGCFEWRLRRTARGVSR